MQADSSPKDRVYATLVSNILTLDLRPGADLDETRLCAEFGLSRTPMREVLRQLAGEGYVTLRQNRGAQVSEMSQTSLRAFFIAAPMIYSAILQLAATHRSADQIDTLRAAQAAFCTALDDGDAAKRALANIQFHRVTGDMSDNLYLSPSFNRLLLDHARISITFYAPQDATQQRNIDTARTQHEAIIDAIVARDAQAAGDLAIAHWQLSRDEIEKYVMPGALDVPLGTTARSAG
ncbi:GntR family transcriptional regulator [uncultured Tateyamaria sp.]|uniref:GntR family transcriptional regulator n=1 Tax=uncultured Tateyamaria sp. TaxID=455651 RepID=UPI0026281FFA|nr:GntR family transcriptional regulator [uncultured Tateyamaria sp.]